MCFCYQKIKIQWKKLVKIFTFARGQTQGGWAPPPPYGQADRKISFFFDAFPKQEKSYFPLAFYEQILRSVKVKSWFYVTAHEYWEDLQAQQTPHDFR